MINVIFVFLCFHTIILFQFANLVNKIRAETFVGGCYITHVWLQDCVLTLADTDNEITQVL